MTSEINDALSESVRKLVGLYSELKWSERGGIAGGEEYVFVKLDHDDDVEPPDILPSITHASGVYFMIPAEIKLELPYSKCVSPRLPDDVAREGNATNSEGEYWPVDAEIIEAIEKHRSAVRDTAEIREATALLQRERQSYSDLYASRVPIDQETPMLIEGLMRERGVSVIYGAHDDFKTTLVLDMMAHVAMGAPWQGRKVKPRPVIWYALEGKDEVPIQLRALEDSLKGKDTPWGDDRAPITMLDRIPENYRDWRAEISRIMERWGKVFRARQNLNDFNMMLRGHFGIVAPWERDAAKETMTVATSEELEEVPEDWAGYVIYEEASGSTLLTPRLKPVYPLWDDECRPIIVIDTLSLALGGDDEKGPKPVGFINDCLDLLKERPDFECPPNYDEEALAQWREQYPGETTWMDSPVAAHVIIIHHQTKTGIDFAGHRAIAANTQGLYRVHRFGTTGGAERPYAGQLTPIRVKGIPRPAPIRFDVDVVPVEGTKQTAAILKDKATAIPKEMRPIIEAFRELENPEEITPTDLNECIDVVAASGGKVDPAKRKARQRIREKLEAAGVIEAVEDENDKLAFYRFHDTAAM